MNPQHAFYALVVQQAALVIGGIVIVILDQPLFLHHTDGWLIVGMMQQMKDWMKLRIHLNYIDVIPL